MTKKLLFCLEIYSKNCWSSGEYKPGTTIKQLEEAVDCCMKSAFTQISSSCTKLLKACKISRNVLHRVQRAFASFLKSLWYTVCTSTSHKFFLLELDTPTNGPRKRAKVKLRSRFIKQLHPLTHAHFATLNSAHFRRISLCTDIAHEKKIAGLPKFEF